MQYKTNMWTGGSNFNSKLSFFSGPPYCYTGGWHRTIFVHWLFLSEDGFTSHMKRPFPSIELIIWYGPIPAAKAIHKHPEKIIENHCPPETVWIPLSFRDWLPTKNIKLLFDNSANKHKNINHYTVTCCSFASFLSTCCASLRWHPMPLHFARSTVEFSSASRFSSHFSWTVKESQLSSLQF